jgi:hypothetical protein
MRQTCTTAAHASMFRIPLSLCFQVWHHLHLSLLCRSSLIVPLIVPRRSSRNTAAMASSASDSALYFGLDSFIPESKSSSPPSGGSYGDFFVTQDNNKSATVTTNTTDTTAATGSTDNNVEPQDEVVCGCEVYNCCGGTWSLGVFDEKCHKRPANNRIKYHSRGQVCTFHHAFVKCQSCRLHVHVGCWVRHNAGYKKMVRGLIWTCQQCTDSKSEVQSKCTLKSEVTAKPEDDAAESTEPKTETKCVFTNRQELMQHARDHGWTTRSGQRGSPRMYFVCQKSLKTNADGKSEGCTVTFKAKAHSVSAILPDGVNIEDVEWCAVNMPTQHDCCKHVLQTALTTRVCRLPRDTYQEIQRLACCKSFNSQSIQQYIKFRYGLIVDVTLIYNIGYRARTKLGIGDVGLLLAQQEVRVYTSNSLLRIFNANRRNDELKATCMNWCSKRATITSRVSSALLLFAP